MTSRITADRTASSRIVDSPVPQSTNTFSRSASPNDIENSLPSLNRNRGNTRSRIDHDVQLKVQEARKLAIEANTREEFPGERYDSEDDSSPSPAAPSTTSDCNHEELRLIERIRTAIDHAARAPDNQVPVAYNNFKLAITDPPSAPLHLLRQCNLAVLIASSPTHAIYSLPIPVAPPVFQAPSEQWWVGLSASETRAGPLREPCNVKQAEREVKHKDGRRRKSLVAKNGLLRQQREYMQESLRRQVLGLPMDGPISGEMDCEALEKHGEEWEDVLAELEDDGDADLDALVTEVDEDEEMEQDSIDGEGEEPMI